MIYKTISFVRMPIFLHEDLRVQLQKLKDRLNSPRWTRNCTRDGREFILNWGKDWDEKMPISFLSIQTELKKAINIILNNEKNGNDQIRKSIGIVKSACATDGWFLKFMKEPYVETDDGTEPMRVTQQVIELFNDTVPIMEDIGNKMANFSGELVNPNDIKYWYWTKEMNMNDIQTKTKFLLTRLAQLQ
jgi:hypothetical protein